ncbi:unnamed protein product [marine sediment metagenome]|uniref:Uncharacterized protein n=1 Tax=marine sediment metagenome TaxID=412755 RepID=X0SVD8_9ZZZZ
MPKDPTKSLPAPVHGLPPENERSAFDTARICKQCGETGRVVSNYLGTQVYCGPCKIDWPISSTPMAPQGPLASPRGLSKVTLVEPNFDKAFEEIGEYADEDVRKRRKLPKGDD